MTIIDDAIDLLDKGLEGVALAVEDVRIGVFYTGVRLASGHAGVAFTPRDMPDAVCCPRTAAEMPAAGKMQGASAWELAAYARADSPLKRAVGVATINALSALLMERQGLPGYRLLAGADALEAISITSEDRVALVGAFIPFIKALKGRVQRLSIIDKHPQILKADELSLWRPPTEAPEVLSQADVAVITGSALVEGGLDELLELCRGSREVALAGPTASMHPEPLFRRGVTAVAGIAVRDPDRLLQIVGEGGSGYFFDVAAEKMAIVREGP